MKVDKNQRFEQIPRYRFEIDLSDQSCPKSTKMMKLAKSMKSTKLIKNCEICENLILNN